MNTSRSVTRFALLTTVVALVVVMLGGYVRLSDAGLGCPDWPGCYGRLLAPSVTETAQVAKDYERPLEVGKAWKEMIHRYLAGVLGLFILALAVIAWRRRREPGQPYRMAALTVGLVIFQAVLGMWTVTLLLKPFVVVLHLLGGFTILALLWWQVLRNGCWWLPRPDVGIDSSVKRFRPWLVLAFVVLIAQVFLGGWTSTNYAALSCPDFPTCHGKWVPHMDLDEGFVLWRGLGQDYEGGVLDGAARVGIHYVHRVGALITFLYIGGFALWLLVAGKLGGFAASIIALLLTQISLGIANVVMGLPLWVAVLHNGVAALLLLSLVTLAHRLWPVQLQSISDRDDGPVASRLAAASQH